MYIRVNAENENEKRQNLLFQPIDDLLKSMKNLKVLIITHQNFSKFQVDTTFEACCFSTYTVG
jgi:hypothetical protein